MCWRRLPGAAGIHYGIGRRLDANGFASHGPGRSGKFLEGLALGGQCRHHSTDLGIRYPATEDFGDHFSHFRFT